MDAASLSLLKVLLAAFFAAVGVSANSWELLAGDPQGRPGSASENRLYYPAVVAVHPMIGNLYVGNLGQNFSNGDVRIVSRSGSVSRLEVPGLTAVASNNGPSPEGIAFSPNHILYISDTSSNRVLRRSSGPFPWSTVTTSGSASPNACGLVVSQKSGLLYVADFFGGQIWKQQPDGTLAVFLKLPQNANPQDVALDRYDNLYIADWTGNAILKYDGSSLLTIGDANTNFGDGSIGFWTPSSVEVCHSTGDIYVIDSFNNAVRLYSPTRKGWSTIGGTACQGQANGVTPTCAAGMSNRGLGSFNFSVPLSFGTLSFSTLPAWITLDYHCNIYVADTGNNQIRFRKSLRARTKQLRSSLNSLDVDDKSLLQTSVSEHVESEDELDEL